MMYWVLSLILIPNVIFSAEIRIDGSSTLYPLSEAIAEEFLKLYPDVKITVGVSGTGGGFKKFLRGETDINNASREITELEKETAKEANIDYIELKIAYDGLTVIVNPRNRFVKSLSIADLREIWKPDSKVNLWSDINRAWPKRSLRLYGPGADSGTFDFFTEFVVGKAKSSRTDYTASEDDYVIITGVSNDVDSLGYVGFSYYISNKKRLRCVPIDAGKGPIEPTYETISSGRYPLSRPLFLYVNKNSLKREEVKKFILFSLFFKEDTIKELGFIPISRTERNKYISELKKEKLITEADLKMYRK